MFFIVDISQYNKVLNYLETSVPNILYLNTFEEDDEDKGSEWITDTNKDTVLVSDEGLEHDYSYILSDTDNIIINFNKDVQEVKIDRFEKIEVTLKSSQKLDFDNVKLDLSRLPDCQLAYMVFNTNPRNCIESEVTDGYLYNLSFDFKDDELVELDKFLTDILSIKVELGVKASIQLYNVCVRQTHYNLYIKDIDEQLVQAKLYILRRIREDTIPTKLESCITRITVAHLWLNKWYEEGQKASTLGEFSTESYYDKLMESVEEDIDQYNKDKGVDEDKRDLDYRFTGSA